MCLRVSMSFRRSPLGDRDVVRSAPLIGLLVLPDGVPDRHKDDADVEQQRPVLQIPDVAPHAALHLAQFVGFAAVARHLGPACDAGFYPVAHHVLADEFRILLRVLKHVRPRADDGHFALEHVDELRQLVDARLAQEVAEPGFAGVVLGRLEPVGVGIDPHRAELDALEYLAVFAVALLPEEDGTLRGQLGADGHEEADERKERREEKRRYDDVERPFDEPVGCLAQRLFADVEDRHVAQQFEVHRALHVVAQVGHVEEPDEMVFAEVHDREYLFQITVGREAAVYFVHVVFAEPFQHVVHLAQKRSVSRQFLLGVVGEESENPVSRVVVVDHFVIDFEGVVLAAHDGYRTGVVPVLPGVFDDDAAERAPQDEQTRQEDVEGPQQVDVQHPVSPDRLQQQEESQMAEDDVEDAPDDLFGRDDARGEDDAEPGDTRDEADVETDDDFQRAGDEFRLGVEHEGTDPCDVQQKEVSDDDGQLDEQRLLHNLFHTFEFFRGVL